MLQGDALSIGGQAKKQGRQEEEGDERRRKKKRAWGWSEEVKEGMRHSCSGREGGRE